MNVREVLRFAGRGLAANKLRSGLTTLGILIGVGAVILLVAVGNGSSQQIQHNIQRLGTNTLTVFRSAGGFGRRAATNTGTQSTASQLTVADAVALADPAGAPDVRSASPISSTSQAATYAGATHQVQQINGTYPSYFEATNNPVVDGTYFTNDDVTAARKVVVLGKTVVDDLFGDVEPVGKTVTIKSIPFRVVGVLASKGTSGFTDSDDVAVAPLTAVQNSLTGFASLNQVVVQASSAASTTAAQAEITAILDQRHHITNPTLADFRILNQASLLSTSTQTSHTFTVLLGAVAAISLVVGGIGITNIMLVTVTERTREIGIRKAIGAPKSAILGQFLVEATLLSVVGGVLGIGAGLIGSQFTVLGVKPVPVPSSILLAFGVSVVIGLFFGSYPANRAASLRPIEALRYE